MDQRHLRQVGKRIPPVDALEKVRGKAVYSADVVLPGMVFGKILRSPFARARIKRIDTSKAEALAGVIAVVTAKNAPKSRFGISVRDERFFASDEVWFVGDEVAAVVATDPATASKATQLIDVDYEPLEAVLDLDTANDPNSPLARSDISSNIAYRTETERGDIRQGFEEADVICEETFYLNHQYQSYIEPPSATAQWDNGRLTLWAAHQAPSQLEKVICEGFNIETGSFRFIQTFMGGGFGGKTHSRAALFSALLSKIVGAPVQVSLSREEDFFAGFPSVPMQIHIRMGAREDGTVSAKEVHFLADNGAFTASALGVVSVASIRVDTLYQFSNLKVLGELLYTNKMATSAFRGYGNSQMHFAVESMMDMLANKLNLDPLEFRLRNAAYPGYVSAHGYAVNSCKLTETIQKAAEIAYWKEKHGQMRAENKGLGMACGMHVSGSTAVKPTGSVAKTTITSDGTIQVMSSEGDIGQGANTVYALIVAELLDTPVEQIRIKPLDTDQVGFSVGAVGSRATTIGGGAVKTSAIKVRKKLVSEAADHWGCDPQRIILRKGKIINLDSEEEIGFGEMSRIYSKKRGGGWISAETIYKPENVELPDQNKYGNVSLGYSYGTHMVELEVDRETGKIQILKMIAVHDSGQVINLLSAEGQVEGALLQGMGWALFEELLFEDGCLANSDFTNYRVPTFNDEPEMEVHFIDSHEPNGPLGAKSLGEVAMVPVAPAILNAIFDATGIRFNEIPVTPERLLKRLKKDDQEKS